MEQLAAASNAIVKMFHGWAGQRLAQTHRCGMGKLLIFNFIRRFRMTTDREEQSKKLGEVIKKAWDDEAFMARLLEDATSVLKEQGIQMPEGMEVKAVQNAENLTYLVVPPKPSRSISDTQLDEVAGGTGLCITYPWRLGDPTVR
jgi:hypothetical protein